MLFVISKYDIVINIYLITNLQIGDSLVYVVCLFLLY